MRDSAPDTAQSAIRPTNSELSLANRWDHILARIGVNRSGHRVAPGLYAIGSPTPESPVFVTSNYTLSFDALRAALPGIDGYILVLDTQGINVWCAAGKGTFGTDELVHRTEAVSLRDVVNHKTLILPQLGAPGVAAHEVKKRSGFKVEYGPVLASDLPEYLKARQATPEMRRVKFPLRDRLVLIPVEIVFLLLPTLIAAVLLFFFGGWLAALGGIGAFAAGTILFPILLPWLPTREFSSKGFILGGLVALPFAAVALFGNPTATWWAGAWEALIYLLVLPSIVAFISLNFTGSTTFTSRTGVRREIFAYIPIMAWTFGGGVVLAIALIVVKAFGGLTS